MRVIDCPGRVVLGDDNEVFGRWNQLVAVSTSGEVLARFPAHGGEVIPGRLEDHIDRLRNNLQLGVAWPVQVDLDPSMACPSSCTFCFSAGYRAARKDGLLMDTRLIVDLISGWAQRGVKVVRFDGGGDPLTHPGLLKAIRHASELGLRTAVLTAGDLLHERHMETFVHCGTYVRVSLNAATDERRAQIHQGHHRLSRTLQRVRTLAGLRRQAYGDRPRRYMLLGATSMLLPENADQTFAIAQQAREAGFDHVSYRVVLGRSHAVNYSSQARDVFDAQLSRVRQDLTDDDFQVFSSGRSFTDTGYVPSEYFDTCLASTHRALIEVGPSAGQAAIVPCGRYRGHGFSGRSDGVVFGFLNAHPDIDTVWQSSTMARMVRSFPGRCADCIDRSANLMLSRIMSVLRHAPDATFLRFSVDEGRTGS
jgi:MoaA/NifB/PqqE/SkfB family radical SAM enzyme